MSKFRGFIAIDIETLPKIIEFENEIKNSGAIVKLVEPENIHITLKFLGDIEEEYVEKIEEIMKDSVNESNSFEIQLKGAGVFPNQNYIKVMWIGIKNGEQIGKIANNIDEKLSELGFEKDRRGYSAHLTIARVRSAKNKDKLMQIIEKYRDIEFANIKVNSIILKKSELTSKGPIYTNLKEVIL
jgi:2'-5' RNA ligase